MAAKKITTTKTTEKKETAKKTVKGAGKVVSSNLEEVKTTSKTPETVKKKAKESVSTKKVEPVIEVKVEKVSKKSSDEKVTKTKLPKSTGGKEVKEVVHKPVIKETVIEEVPVAAEKIISKPAPAKEHAKNKSHVQLEPEIPVTQHKPETVIPVKGYSKEDLEHFREIIIAKKNEIYEQLQNLKEQMLDPTTGEYINENSPYSLHMAEQGTDAMEREKTFLYAQRENKFLGYLDEALKRIDAGTYGICIECIDEPQHLCPTCPLVPKARLEAVPHSQLCVPIKMRQEKKK